MIYQSHDDAALTAQWTPTLISPAVQSRLGADTQRPADASRSSDAWTEDPVRQYLEQMSRYPLLGRTQEIALAKRVEVTRRRFRRGVLDCDFALREAVELLRQVHSGQLSFDRTVQVSVSDRLEAHHIRGRLPHNLRTVEAILERNREDFRIAVRRSHSRTKRLRAWRRLSGRRRRAVRLIEESDDA